jgi:hypothetical protein
MQASQAGLPDCTSQVFEPMAHSTGHFCGTQPLSPANAVAAPMPPGFFMPHDDRQL